MNKKDINMLKINSKMAAIKSNMSLPTLDINILNTGIVKYFTYEQTLGCVNGEDISLVFLKTS